MDIIFDINEIEGWADDINEEIENTFPDYFSSNAKIGTEEWWNSLTLESAKGEITHVGPIVEEGALFDVVSIQPLNDDLNVTYETLFTIEQKGFWKSHHVNVGKFVQITSTTICPNGEIDEHAIYVETKVGVW